MRSDAFVAREIFDLEIKFIFEKTWVLLGIESQIRAPNDFLTAAIGRTSVLVTRDAGGVVRGFVNACRHKGAKLSELEEGNARYHVCAYHGWAYDASGRNVDIKDRRVDGCYGAGFDQANHDLIPLPAFGSYRGLLFGSLSADVPPLEDFLGEMRGLLDLTLDQGPNGMEFVPGRSIYTFKANWKLQMDNGLDYYHLTSAHVSYMEILRQRYEEKTGNLDAKQFDWSRRMNKQSGMFGFDHGHSAVWLEQAQPENRVIWNQMQEIESRIGKTRAAWMLNLRQYLVFPNMQIADSSATVFRTFRPVAPDLTEMRVMCFAPVGEPPENRAMRIRQFEDFYSASGFATPDDTVVFEKCQAALTSSSMDWLQGYMRGIPSQVRGPTDEARAIGINPSFGVSGPFEIQNEIAYHPAFREWMRLLSAGVEGRPAYG